MCIRDRLASVGGDYAARWIRGQGRRSQNIPPVAGLWYGVCCLSRRGVKRSATASEVMTASQAFVGATSCRVRSRWVLNC